MAVLHPGDYALKYLREQRAHLTLNNGKCPASKELLTSGMMDSFFAIACAVEGWSPVTMTTWHVWHEDQRLSLLFTLP